jgi:hypothetical protein
MRWYIELTALGTIVLVATVLGQEGKVDNLADIQLARSSGDRDWVIVGSGPLIVKSAADPSDVHR